MSLSVRRSAKIGLARGAHLETNSLNVSGTLTESLRTTFATGATATTGPTAGAGEALPGDPVAWLQLNIKGTEYLLPMWTGAI
jgi:hypothetical protein